MRTDQQIAEQANRLATRFAEQLGYTFMGETKLYNSADPRLRQCWRLACIAFEDLQGTPADEALENLRDDGSEPSEGELNAAVLASMSKPRETRRHPRRTRTERPNT